STLEAVLFNRSLELAQELVTAIGHGRGHADNRAVILVLAFGIETILTLAALELLLAIHLAQIVDWVRDHGDIDAADLGRLERVLDRGRRRLMARPDVLVELCAGEGSHVLGRQDMHVEVNDHGLPGYD